MAKFGLHSTGLKLLVHGIDRAETRLSVRDRRLDFLLVVDAFESSALCLHIHGII